MGPYKKLLNFKYFDEIRKIPRMSFHEEAIADYLEMFAQDNGFWYHRDEIGNIIIKKPATKGKENSDPIILQAHIDMVCEKDPGCEHDFLKDPIDIYVEDGWIRARGTTLGADDGAGIANILALLSEAGLTHPPLECVFTVQEEEGMGGAKHLDFSLLESKRMIGLDGIEEGTTIFSASEVYGGQIKKRLVKSSQDFKSNIFKLRVEGLSSGHGALKIGSEQANAIKVSARLLYHLNKKFGIRLCHISGGGLVHVIPRECTSIFEIDRSINAEVLLAFIKALKEQIKLEYSGTDPDMEISCNLISYDGFKIDKNCSDEIIDLIYLLPVGAAKRNADNLEHVEGSWNISIVRTENEEFLLTDICRANYPMTTEELRSLVWRYAEIFGATYEETFSYSGHYVSRDSPLTRIWERVYKERTGMPLKKTFMHSALDAGTIYKGLGEIDLIVVMPTVCDVHTPKERMNIDSFARTYQYLKDILYLA